MSLQEEKISFWHNVGHKYIWFYWSNRILLALEIKLIRWDESSDKSLAIANKWIFTPGENYLLIVTQKQAIQEDKWTPVF